MADPIQGARISFDTFLRARDNGKPFTKSDMENLLDHLINDNDTKNKFHRFQQGYAAEELFRRIYSLLPWVKLITPLGQEQLPAKSKEEVQVPDYKLTFEVQKPGNTAMCLVEVKLVSGEKETLGIQNYKLEVLSRYAANEGLPLLYAIYWEKHVTWTLNSIESFTRKNSQVKISYQEALLNDISAIVGDYTYIFVKRPLRRSIFSTVEPINREYLHIHKKYGFATKDEVAADGQNYVPMIPLEPAVIDSALAFEQVNYKRLSDTNVELLEQVKAGIAIHKLSTLIMRYLATIYCFDTSDLYCIYDNITVEYTFNTVDGLRQKCGGYRCYALPNKRTTELDLLVKQQFGNVPSIYVRYINDVREPGTIPIYPHDALEFSFDDLLKM